MWQHKLRIGCLGAGRSAFTRRCIVPSGIALPHVCRMTRIWIELGRLEISEFASSASSSKHQGLS